MREIGGTEFLPGDENGEVKSELPLPAVSGEEERSRIDELSRATHEKQADAAGIAAIKEKTEATDGAKEGPLPSCKISAGRRPFFVYIQIV